MESSDYCHFYSRWLGEMVAQVGKNKVHNICQVIDGIK